MDESMISGGKKLKVVVSSEYKAVEKVEDDPLPQITVILCISVAGDYYLQF